VAVETSALIGGFSTNRFFAIRFIADRFIAAPKN
jgi:hypothetical protein